MQQYGVSKVSYPQSTSKTESFASIVNGYKPLTIVAKLSIVDALRSPGYAFGFYLDNVFMFIYVININL